MTRRIVDAHVHLWRLAETPQPWVDPVTMPQLARDFMPDDLRSALGGTGGDLVVGPAVAVQSANTASETGWLASTVGDTVAAVVGWVDLTADGVADDIAALPGAVCGVRHLAHEEADDEWLLRPAVGRGLDALAAAGLPFDLVLHAPQLPIGIRMAEAHPELTLVLDHLGNPPLESGELHDWELALRAVANRSGAAAKVSGLVTHLRRSDWSLEDLRPVLDAALDAFGPDRLMFGSDWPLVKLAGGYGRWLEAYLAWSAALSADERHAIDRGTAERIYLR